MLDKSNKKLDIIKWRPRSMKTIRNPLSVSGIVVYLAGTGLLLDRTILGEKTSVATVLVIAGIGLISTQRSVKNNGGE